LEAVRIIFAVRAGFAFFLATLAIARLSFSFPRLSSAQKSNRYYLQRSKCGTSVNSILTA
jgi:hypothetical protein